MIATRWVGPYRELFGVPGGLRIVGGGLGLRMPMSMMSIGWIMAYTGLVDGYDRAGLLAGAHLVSAALAGPRIGALVDVRGQVSVLAVSLSVHVVAVAAALTALMCGAPLAVLVVCAVATGGSYGSMGSMVRSRWRFVVYRHTEGDETTQRRSRLMNTAYALEGVADEVAFVVGPPLVVFLALSVHPVAGIGAATACLAVGAVVFLSARGTEPPATGARHTKGSVLGFPGVVRFAGVLCALGAVFGCMDVSTIAVTEEAGHPELAGMTLAMFAAGSMVSGLWFGTQDWAVTRLAEHTTRLAVSLAALVVALIPTIVAAGSMWLPATCFAAGLAISPALISAVSVMSDLVPDARATEGLAWVSTSIATGVAVGVSGLGWATEQWGPGVGFALTTAVAGCAAVAGAALAVRASMARRAGEPKIG